MINIPKFHPNDTNSSFFFVVNNHVVALEERIKQLQKRLSKHRLKWKHFASCWTGRRKKKKHTGGTNNLQADCLRSGTGYMGRGSVRSAPADGSQQLCLEQSPFWWRSWSSAAPCRLHRSRLLHSRAGKERIQRVRATDVDKTLAGYVIMRKKKRKRKSHGSDSMNAFRNVL